MKFILFVICLMFAQLYICVVVLLLAAYFSRVTKHVSFCIIILPFILLHVNMTVAHLRISSFPFTLLIMAFIFASE